MPGWSLIEGYRKGYVRVEIGWCRTVEREPRYRIATLERLHVVPELRNLGSDIEAPTTRDL